VMVTMYGKLGKMSDDLPEGTEETRCYLCTMTKGPKRSDCTVSFLMPVANRRKPLVVIALS